MIVDDHQDIIDTIEIIVQKLGHEPIQAHNGSEFIQKITESTPDLVLLDVMMPGMTTKDILDKLQEMNKTSLKIILVTVVRFSFEEEKTLMKNSNVVGYIPKPFSIKQIIDEINKHVENA